MGVSAVPGAMWPGSVWPGEPLAGTVPTGTYPYYGYLPLYYLDYLDTATQETLVAVPGGSYTMIPVNSRAGLTVPPPNEWWTLGGGMHLRRPAAPLSRAEIAAARERALAAHGHYVSAACPQCDPAPRESPPARPATPEAALSTHGHYPGGACGHCDPARGAAPPPLPPLAAHGHYPGSQCGQCEPASRESVTVTSRVPGPDFAPQPPPRPPVTADQARAAHGHYPGSTCRQCDPAPTEPEPVIRRADGPDFAPTPSMAEIRAALAASPIVHGHYTPCRCAQCADGGQAG